VTGYTWLRQKEHAQETIRFWRAAREYRTLPATARATKASDICATFVTKGSPEEVNMSQALRLAIEQKVMAAAVSVESPEATLYAHAEAEIFNLMERNAFSRLRGDPQGLVGLADDFFACADKDSDGAVSFDEYSKWASQQPEVLAFFGQLRRTILKLVVRTGTIVELHASG
jgi:hypothetical protein